MENFICTNHGEKFCPYCPRCAATAEKAEKYRWRTLPKNYLFANGTLCEKKAENSINAHGLMHFLKNGYKRRKP